MGEVEKLVRKSKTSFQIVEEITRIVDFNCLGEKINERTTSQATAYFWDDKSLSWKRMGSGTEADND